MKLSTRPFSANKKLHFFITISDAPFVYTLDHVSQDKDKNMIKKTKIRINMKINIMMRKIVT